MQRNIYIILKCGKKHYNRVYNFRNMDDKKSSSKFCGFEKKMKEELPSDKCLLNQGPLQTEHPAPNTPPPKSPRSEKKPVLEELDLAVKHTANAGKNAYHNMTSSDPIPQVAPPPNNMRGTYVRQDSNNPGQAPQPRQRVIAAPRPEFGKSPINMECNYCHEEVTTKTVSSVGAAAWAGSGAIAACAFVTSFFCLCLPLLCVCVPCCIPSFRDTTHYCPNCGQVLGRYNANRKMFD